MVVENTHRPRTLLKLFQLAGVPAPSPSGQRRRPAVVPCAIEQLEERALFNAGPIGPQLPLDQAPVGVHRDAGGGPGVVWPREDGGGSGKSPGHDQGNGKDHGGKGDGSGHQGDGSGHQGDGSGHQGDGSGSGKTGGDGSNNGDGSGSGKGDGGAAGKSNGGSGNAAGASGGNKSGFGSGSGNNTSGPTGSPGSNLLSPTVNHSFALLTTAGSPPWVATGSGNSSAWSSNGGHSDLSFQPRASSSALGGAASSGASADSDADASPANSHARVSSEKSTALAGKSGPASAPALAKFLTQPADRLFAASVTLPGLDFARLGEELDALGSQLDSAARTHSQEIALVAALSAAASVGYALWNLNQGRLARAALAGVPLTFGFEQFDPLAYLDAWEQSRR
jgi:hypothetical protein